MFQLSQNQSLFQVLSRLNTPSHGIQPCLKYVQRPNFLNDLLNVRLLDVANLADSQPVPSRYNPPRSPFSCSLRTASMYEKSSNVVDAIFLSPDTENPLPTPYHNFLVSCYHYASHSLQLAKKFYYSAIWYVLLQNVLELYDDTGHDG